uniref:Coiled-coil domain containing 59 n=1 Tax=Anas platyrhynchos platyrhynchos TaxID=8840 RepID=A0A493TI98_ANAPP
CHLAHHALGPPLCRDCSRWPPGVPPHLSHSLGSEHTTYSHLVWPLSDDSPFFPFLRSCVLEKEVPLEAGQGFAFRRKQKIERKYRKLLKKERKINSPQDNQFVDTYPEHLKHLYLAEEERLKKQHKRRDDSVLSEEKLNVAVESVTTEEKFKKKTSNQKAKEEYEKIKAERAKKKEDVLQKHLPLWSAWY